MRLTLERFGRIDVVIANAGVLGRGGTMRALHPDQVAGVLSVNVDGVVNTVSATMESVIGSRGQIVVVSSVFAYINGAGAIPYAMSKAAVEQLGRGLGVELASHGASAMTAYFSLIETDMIRQGVDADPHVLALLVSDAQIHTQAHSAADCGRRDRRRAGTQAAFRYRPRPLATRRCASRSGGPDRRCQTRARCRGAASPCPTRKPLVFVTVLMPSTLVAYPQVFSRTFASFRVTKFGVSAGQQDFCAEFDSRQLHKKGPCQGRDFRPGPF